MTESPYLYLTHVLTRRNSDDFALVADGRSVRTWGEFTRAVHAWQLAFAAAGVQRVALYFHELFDSAASLFGAWAAGVTVVLPADVTPITCQRLAQNVVTTCAGDFPDDAPLKRIVPTTKCGTPCRAVIDETKELLELFTSGSTGAPTCVKKRLEQLFTEVDSISRRPEAGGRLTDDSIILSTVSQQHIYGLLYFLLLPVARRVTAWAHRCTQPQELLNVAGRHPHCAWVASPAWLKRLPESPDWEKTLGHWQVIFSSGGPLSDEAIKRTITLTGLSPTELLGSSEAGGIATRSRSLSEAGEVVPTPWRPLPSVQWRSANGLLAIKSTQLYTRDWEVMNDMIEPCADGETFRHLGRTDRVVKINEKRVSLTAVEERLTQSPCVLAAKALQLEDARRSLAVVATLRDEGIRLLRTRGKFALVQTLRATLAQSLERTCLPRRWRFVSELPENSMGKTTTTALAALFSPTALQSVLVERMETSARYVVAVAANLPYFEGHFPQFAILPGLTQIQWAVALAREAFAPPPYFAGLRQLKFMKPIRPGDTIEVQLTLAADADAVTVEFTHASDKVAKMKLCFSEKEPS